MTAERIIREWREYARRDWRRVGTMLGQVLGTADAKARNSAAGALEEDARLTALFLWTLQTTNSSDAEDTGTEPEEEEESDEDEEEGTRRRRKRGFTLIYDVARRFAQPLGIHLDDWKGRIIEIEKGVVRLLSVSDRAAQLFGKEGAAVIADRIEREPTGQIQLTLFTDSGGAPDVQVKAPKEEEARGVVGRTSGKTPLWGHDARPRPRGHAASGKRPSQCPPVIP